MRFVTRRALKAEVARLQDELAHLMGIDDTELRLASFVDGRFDMRPPHWFVGLMVGAFKSMLDEADAPNYVEATYKAAGSIDEYRVTIHRPGRPTPHQLREKAEAELAALRAEVSVAREHDGQLNEAKP